MYFTDTGLCSYLTGWTSPETLEAGAMNGAMLDTHVVMEIVKSFWHRGLEAPIYFYRDKEKNEIDVVIEADGVLHPVEIKKTANPSLKDIRHFRMLDNTRLKRGVSARSGALGDRALPCCAFTLHSTLPAFHSWASCRRHAAPSLRRRPGSG